MKKGTISEEGSARIKMIKDCIEILNEALILEIQIEKLKGASWAQLADVMGVSKQTAYERYRNKGESSV